MALREPLWLLGLLSLPLFLLVCKIGSRRGRLHAVRFTNVDVLAAVARTERSRRHRVPLALYLATLALLALALARPAISRTHSAQGSIVVLAVDVSGSMAAADIRPSRLRAAELAAHAFVQRLPKNADVGIVTFSNDAQVVAAPTTDRRLVAGAIDSLHPLGATAIGDGLTRALELIEQTMGRRRPSAPAAGRARPARVLLLSDGTNNAGRTSPIQAARAARRLGVAVDTIALGAPPAEFGSAHSPSSGPGMSPEPQTLSTIAQLSGGDAFAADDGPRLTGIYRRLADTMSNRRRTRKEVSAFALVGAATLLVAGGLSSLSLRPRLP